MSKKAQFAVYISDIPVTLKQSQSQQTYNENVASKVIIMQNLKDLALTVSEKKEMLDIFSHEVICQLSPLNNHK